MKTLEEIQQAIQPLTTDELRQIATWLADHRQSRWDEEVKNDVETGRFDILLTDFHSVYERGKTETDAAAASSEFMPDLFKGTLIEGSSRIGKSAFLNKLLSNKP